MQIQLPTWKKQKFDSPANLSYHHTLRNTINIEITNSKEEENSNQEVNKQNPILENSGIKTLINQTLENQKNQNPNVINQHLPSVIMINPPPAPPNAEQQQQSQLLSQQQIQQQPQQQPMAYASIAKIEKFISEENNTQNTVINVRDFELAELEANHAQAINLVMNGSSELDSKLKQFTANLSTSNLSTNNTCHLSTATPINLSAAVTIHLSVATSENVQPNNLKTNQYPTLTSNILPATITENESLDAIFSFELEELSTIQLFSEAALEEKPITVMYTDAKVDGHFIKLILNSRSASSIITKQLIDQLDCRIDYAASTRIITANKTTKTSIDKVDNFPIKVNGIIVPIKVLIMEATQYQAFIEKQKETKLTWNTDQTWETNNNQDKLTWEWKEDNNKEKRKEKEKKTTPNNSTYNLYTYTSPQSSGYHQPKLLCVDCGKKLSSMGACCGDDEEYSTVIIHIS
ncbi:hypothetical protein G9A89_005542 [Geosiphon pyriformis]|nr:hypothetical protein G9A89_005542 [Geosiphon pyriformis]